MKEPLDGDGFVLRRATPADLEFIVELSAHEDVEPYMAAMAAREPEEVLREIELSTTEPEHYGRFVVEVGGEPAGLMAFEVSSRRSRIANLRGLMLLPAYRGRGIADAAAKLLVRHLVYELDFHRVQLECYGYNERAIRHAERAGFVREGVRRKAYRRHGEWADSVLFGLVGEDWQDGSKRTSTWTPGSSATE